MKARAKNWPLLYYPAAAFIVAFPLGYALGRSGRPVYDFFKDQGSMIAGILALIAGGMAYVAGLRQAAATRQAAVDQIKAIADQNDQLKRAEKRHLARQTLSSARIVEGVLKALDRSIGEPKFGGDLNRDIGMAGTNQIRERIPSPPRHEMAPYLQYLGREVIDNYFSLCSQIEDFKKQSASVTAAYLSDELQKLHSLVSFICDELDQESKRALAVLAE